MDPLLSLEILKELLPKSIHEAILLPASEEIGRTLSDFTVIAISPVSLTTRYGAHWVRSIQKKIDKKFKEIPDEQKSFDNVNLETMTKYIEDMKFSLNSDEIREAFAELLVSSFDKRRTDSVHPAFSTILRDLTPLDAKNLFVIYEKYGKESFPIVDYKSTAPNGSFNIDKQNVFLENEAEFDIDSQTLSIENLQRTNLLTIDNRFKWGENTYDKFELTNYYLQRSIALELISEHNAGLDTIPPQDIVNTLNIDKKIGELTTFGKLFCDVCFNGAN